MKVNGQRAFDKLLKNWPPDIEVVVLHGADQGLIRERSILVEAAVLGRTLARFSALTFPIRILKKTRAGLKKKSMPSPCWADLSSSVYG